MPVILALKDSFPLIGGHERPFIPYIVKIMILQGVTFSKMNPRILPSHLHFAHIMQISAMGELVIHVFDPERE
jgi:hypothetical protein